MRCMILIFTFFMDYISARQENICHAEDLFKNVKNEDPAQQICECGVFNDSIVVRGSR